ncbi:MAG: 2'-5' RNA ligase family protein, partial [Ktedonobacterales bacterium]|nr:2'-5' RNA ligase family protein [Ktedonobacterales bacterium]
RISGLGRFTAPEGQPQAVYASVDSPGLLEMRHALRDVLEAQGMTHKISDLHGFTPHITLAYVDADTPTPVIDLPDLTMTLDRVTIARGDGVVFTAPLSGEAERATLTPAEREALQTSFFRVLSDVALARSVDMQTGYRPPSAPRLAVRKRLTAAAGERFTAQRVRKATVQRVLDVHLNRSVLISKRIDPDLKDGVAALIEGRELGLPVRLSGAERDAVRASIRQLLLEDIPDYDAGWGDLLITYAVDAYNVGGQDALDHGGLPGIFNLTNQQIIDQLGQAARQRSQGIQRTTRDRLATTLLTALENGDDVDTASAAVQATLDGMADGRADDIAGYETSLNYYNASSTTWSRNGYEGNVWRTTADPDPYAGATGPTPCRDNAYAGVVPFGEAFPSGDAYPPAHDRCQCDLIPAGDPSDAADAEPWTGD